MKQSNLVAHIRSQFETVSIVEQSQNDDDDDDATA